MSQITALKGARLPEQEIGMITLGDTRKQTELQLREFAKSDYITDTASNLLRRYVVKEEDCIASICVNVVDLQGLRLAANGTHSHEAICKATTAPARGFELYTLPMMVETFRLFKNKLVESAVGRSIYFVSPVFHTESGRDVVFRVFEKFGVPFFGTVTISSIKERMCELKHRLVVAVPE